MLGQAGGGVRAQEELAKGESFNGRFRWVDVSGELHGVVVSESRPATTAAAQLARNRGDAFGVTASWR